MQTRAEFVLLVVIMLAAGAATATLAGVFGAGALMVPVLYEVFGVMGLEEVVGMRLAVGMSMAIIISTSIRSYCGHKACEAEDDALLRAWAHPILAGVPVGAGIARFAPPVAMQAVLVLVAGINAINLNNGTAR